jgi:hypothetical protein
MKKNKFGVFAFFAAVFLICYGAQGVSAQDNTNWRKADSDNDFAGIWEGSMDFRIPKNEEEMIPESSIGVTVVLEYSRNAENANANFRIKIRFDMEKFLNDFLNIPLVRQYGLTLDSLWDMFASEMKPAMGDFGNDVIIKKYYISYNISENIDEFLYDSSRESILLNDDKTRMKLIFDEAIPANIVTGEGITEIILNKVN